MKKENLTEIVDKKADEMVDRIGKGKEFQEAQKLIEKSLNPELSQKVKNIYHLQDSMVESFSLLSKLQMPPVRTKVLSFATVPVLGKLTTLVKNILFPALTAQEEYNRQVYNCLVQIVSEMEKGKN